MPNTGLGGSAMQRQQSGAPELAEGAYRCRNELVGDHAAADEAGIEVTEVVRRDTRTRSDIVVHRVLEDPQRTTVEVALQVTPHLIGVVANPVRLGLTRAAQQQTRRLDSASGEHHVWCGDQ